MEVVVKKWGEKMNSPHSHRRNLFFEIQPAEEDIIKTLKHVVVNLKILLGQWEYSLGSEWWVNHRECSYCKTRQKYEISKFTDCEWAWNRRYCMRHYLVYHLSELLHDENIESNRYFEFGISKQEITVKFATNNYDYNVTIHRSSATLVCNYKGTKYTFTYRNHTNSLPYTNTYFVLLRAVCRFADELHRFLARLAYNDTNDNIWYNVYINNALYV